MDIEQPADVAVEAARCPRALKGFFPPIHNSSPTRELRPASSAARHSIFSVLGMFAESIEFIR